MIIDLKKEADVEAMVEIAQGGPVMLFKHSTRCPTSAYAWAEFQHFADTATVPCYRVLVVEDRELSLHLAHLYQVPHQSPQALLLFQGRAKWHASHYDISQSSLEAAVTAP